jgi:hypothetical protein
MFPFTYEHVIKVLAEYMPWCLWARKASLAQIVSVKGCSEQYGCGYAAAPSTSKVGVITMARIITSGQRVKNTHWELPLSSVIEHVLVCLSSVPMSARCNLGTNIKVNLCFAKVLRFYKARRQ